MSSETNEKSVNTKNVGTPVKTKKWRQRINKLSRDFDQVGNSLSAFKSRLSGGLKSASKKIGYGEEKYLDKARKLQKRKLRDIHQQVYRHEQEDIRRAAVETELKQSIEALSILGDNTVPKTPLINEQPSSDAVGKRLAGSSSTIIITSDNSLFTQGKWTEESKVNRAVFLKRINEYVNESLVEWTSIPPKKRGSSSSGKFIFISRATEKPIHLLTTDFFTNTLFDDTETISWLSFKEDIFYHYLKSMAENQSKIKKEIGALKIIKRVFKELLSETIMVDESGKEEKVSEITYHQLFKRLGAFEKSFDVTDNFWNLACWSEENKDEVTNESDFVNNWISGKSIEELQQTLKEYEDEERSNLPIKSLILTGKDEDNFFDSSSEEIIEEEKQEKKEEKEEKKGKEKLTKEKDSISDAKKKFIKNIWSIKGVPKEVATLYIKFSKPSRLILRRLIIVAKTVSNDNGSRLAVAKQLFSSNIILYDTALEEHRLSIVNAQEKHEQDVRKAKKVAKKGIDNTQPLIKEYELIKESLNTALEKLVDEKNKLNTLFHNNFRKEFAALTITPSKKMDEYSLISRSTFLNQQVPNVRKVAALKMTTDKKDEALPHIVDYTSEIHESFLQVVGDLGYLFVTLLIKEWQQYNATGSLERLSLEFLKSLVVDYNSDPEKRTAVDALDVLKLHGICTEKEFQDFYARKDRNSGKARSKILTQALYNSVDEYFELETVDEIRSSLYYFGPLMVTLPVHNKFETHFWQKEPSGSFNLPSSSSNPPSSSSSNPPSSSSSNPPSSSSSNPPSSSSSNPPSSSNTSNLKGGTGEAPAAPEYHTVAIVGHNEDRQVFILRNSRGKSYGNFGNVEISYNEILIDSQIIAVTDKNRRVTKDEKKKKAKVVDMDQVTSTILSGLSLVEYGNDKRISL